MIPFYTFYSMFGFQRVGDLIWQAADSRARGFLLGATAGRTTLLGEGLQHQDGHSLVLASTVPAVQAYDPAFAYEVAAIVQLRHQRMYGADGPTPRARRLLLPHALQRELPDAADARARAARGERDARAVPLAPSARGPGRSATLLFSGIAHGAALEAAEELAANYDVGVELWSATSYKALREEALRAERWNRLHPSAAPRADRHRAARRQSRGPIIAVTDFMKIVPEQIARFVPGARSSRSAPTGWAAATPARRCAATSRSTRATSSSACSAPSPRTAQSTSPTSRRRSPMLN